MAAAIFSTISAHVNERQPCPFIEAVRELRRAPRSPPNARRAWGYDRAGSGTEGAAYADMGLKQAIDRRSIPVPRLLVATGRSTFTRCTTCA